jgi:2'-5' RNA ligase
MFCDPCRMDRINSFALVSYVPGRLGEFLDRLREEMVAGCKAHAHVTMLPPRPLSIGTETAAQSVRAAVEGFSTFPVEMTRVEVFQSTDVIYLGIGKGRSDVIQLHAALNTDGLHNKEPHEFCPHVTLAQGLSAEQVAEGFELASRRWLEWGSRRSYLIDTLTLVQNTSGNNWVDLTTCELAEPAIHI